MTSFLKFYDSGLNMYPSYLRSYSNINPRFFPNISIQKHIERHQLIGLLQTWLQEESSGELRRKAIQAIVDFYDKESDPISANQPKELNLSYCQLKSLPPVFSWPPFTGLVNIDLSHNRLQTLPPMNRLQDLQKISLKSNYFEYLPDILLICTNIKHLDFSNNKLLQISPKIGELKKLNILDLSSNEIDLLPPEVNELRSLEFLFLNNNHLEELPNINRLQKCKKIHLSNNEFHTFPITLSTLPNLEGIDFSENHLLELPSSVKNLQKLTELNLSNNQFTVFPSCILHLTELKELILEHNKLSELHDLHLLHNLRVLSINCNAIDQLPSTMTLPPLTQLFMADNNLKNIPACVTNCVSLTLLSLNENRLTTLPNAIGNLTNLEDLFLSVNDLRSLPASFTALKKLEVLELESNEFTEFPQEILELSHLQKLNLDDNEITELPSWLPQLKNLQELSISENRLTNLPNYLEDLPASLDIILDGNLFSAEEVVRIQTIVNNQNYRGPILQGLEIQEEEDENLPGRNIAEIYNLLFQFSKQPPREFLNLPTHSLTLLSWLQRLGRVAEFRTSTNKQLLSTKILEILATANENPSFRETFFKVIEDASQSCGDRVALSIIHLDLRQQLDTADLTKIQEVSSFLLRGTFAMKLLEDHALKQIKEKKATDDIETFLAYPIKLKEDLNLPFTQGNMRYFECSQVTREDLQEAKEMVLSHQQNPEKYLSFLIDHDVWRKALSLNYPKTWQRIENNKKRALEVDEPDYSGILKQDKEEIKILTEKVLHHPETIEMQTLQDPLDFLINCLEKSKFNAPLAAKALVAERENLLGKVFSNGKTKEQILDKVESLLATLYFFYQQKHIKNGELFSFLLTTSSSTNSVSSISSCVKEILPRNSGRLYVEILHNLFEQQELREEIFKSFLVREKNPLNAHAKNVNLLTQLTQLTNATFRTLKYHSVNTHTTMTLNLFSLLKNIKDLSDKPHESSSIKRMRTLPEKDIEFLLSRFEELRKIMEPLPLPLDAEKTVLHAEDIVNLLTNYKECQNLQVDKTDCAVEKNLATTCHSLNEKFKDLYARKSQEAQKSSIDVSSLVASTWLTGASQAVPTPSLSIPLPPQNVPRTSHTLPCSATATTSNSKIHKITIDTADPVEAALACLPTVVDTPLRQTSIKEAERAISRSARSTNSRTAMMDPSYKV